MCICVYIYLKFTHCEYLHSCSYMHIYAIQMYSYTHSAHTDIYLQDQHPSWLIYNCEWETHAL